MAVFRSEMAQFQIMTHLRHLTVTLTYSRTTESISVRLTVSSAVTVYMYLKSVNSIYYRRLITN